MNLLPVPPMAIATTWSLGPIPWHQNGARPITAEEFAGARNGSFWAGPDVEIRRQLQADGRVLWAVSCAGSCLTKSGEWVYEPNPSSRDAAFLEQARFETFKEALDAYGAYFVGVVKGEIKQ